MIKKPSVQTLNDPTCLNCNFNLPLVSTFDGGAANFAPILFRVSSPKPSKMHLTGWGGGGRGYQQTLLKKRPHTIAITTCDSSTFENTSWNKNYLCFKQSRGYKFWCSVFYSANVNLLFCLIGKLFSVMGVQLMVIALKCSNLSIALYLCLSLSTVAL